MNATTIIQIDPDFESRLKAQEILQSMGYTVVGYSSYDEAKSALHSQKPDLVICETRLNDPDDEDDQSGILLAHEFGSQMPFIFWTNAPSVDTVTQVMKPNPPEFSSLALDYISKDENIVALIASVTKAAAAAQERRERNRNRKIRLLVRLMAVIAVFLAAIAGVMSLITGQVIWLFAMVILSVMMLVGLGVVTILED